MVVGPDGRLPLPWIGEPLAEALRRRRGHAWLVQAAPGTGALEFSLCLAQAWLCEACAEGESTGPCGRCTSCRAVGSRSHPDLLVLLPEALRREAGWPWPGDKPESAEREGAESRAARKPSRQLRIDEVRALIDWTATTPSRGRVKAAVVHPADELNLQAASALLKTLEEPPAAVRLVLTTADPARLLPTVRSRCQPTRLPLPPRAQALAWLGDQGVEQGGVLLDATGGAPQTAVEWARGGFDANAWTALPDMIGRGQASALAGWPLPRAVDALLRLCHDLLRVAVQGAPRYFPAPSLPAAQLDAVQAWQRELLRVARHDGHPWNEALLLESLVDQGRHAMKAGTTS